MIYSGMFFRKDDDELSVDRDLILSNRQFALGAGAVLLVALILRTLRISAGLPDMFEEATPFFKAKAMWNWGSPGVDFNPHFFNYPALTFYLHWLVQGGHYLVGRIIGAYPDLASFQQSFSGNLSTHIILARLVDVLCDVGTIALLISLTQRYFGEGYALCAGVILAVCPLHIEFARQINVDVPMTFFTVAALHALVSLQVQGTFRGYMMTGVYAGLAASCKYTAVAMVFALVGVHLFRVWPFRGGVAKVITKEFLASVLVAELVFLAANPFSVMDPQAFRRDFEFESLHVSTGHFGIAQGSSSAAFYFLNSLPESLGWIGVALAVYGMADRIIQRKKEWLPVFFTLLAIGLPLTLSKMYADRYLLPLVPPLVLFTVAGIRSLARTVQTLLVRYRWSHMYGTAVIVILIAIMIQPALAVVGQIQESMKTDTRAAAREWIVANLPRGSVIVKSPLGISVPPNRVVFDLPYSPLNMESLVSFYDARWFVDCDAVIGSYFDRARFTREPDRYRQFLRYFYDTLETSWDLNASFLSGREFQGPRIWIYSYPGDTSEVLFDSQLLARLDSVRNQRMVVGFCLNMSSILDWKGKHRKADQIWGKCTETILARGEPQQTLNELSELPAMIRQTSRFKKLESDLLHSFSH